jgi:hypothetical protein
MVPGKFMAAEVMEQNLSDHTGETIDGKVLETDDYD